MTRFVKVTPRLPVNDLRRSIDFYTGVLGFGAGPVSPEGSPPFVLLDRDDVCVQFYLADKLKGEPVDHCTLSFDVSDARTSHAGLVGLAADEWGPEVYWYGRREFAIRDPSGYLIIFSESTSDQPTCHDESTD